MLLAGVALRLLPLAAAWVTPQHAGVAGAGADAAGEQSATYTASYNEEVPLLHRRGAGALASPVAGRGVELEDSEASAGSAGSAPCPFEEPSVAPIFVVDAGSSGSRLSRYNMCADGRVKKTSLGSLGSSYGHVNANAFINPPLAEFLRPGADLAAMQQRFAADLSAQLQRFDGFDAASAPEVFVFGTGGVREASKGTGAAELTEQFRSKFLAAVPQLLAEDGLGRVSFSVEILDDREEARLEAQAAMKAVGNRMDLVGVVGAGGSSFQLTELASGLVESTPWGARSVFADDEAHGRFRKLFKEPTHEGFLEAFEGAYGAAKGKRSLDEIRASIEGSDLPFRGTWVVMSGLCMSAQDVPGMEEFARNCMAAEVNRPVAVGVAREHYLRFVLDFVASDEPPGSVPEEKRRSPASAAVMLWHLLRFFSSDAELYFAKKVEGIDLSANAGYALRRFTCSSTFII